ncbi:hypothetical protein PIB30_105166, partial [Stylosanthes scabra]|nr:hypothetical protein [Stylosanthes scabra]
PGGAVGVPRVTGSKVLCMLFGAFGWGENKYKSQKGTSHMAGQGDEQLERDADINRFHRTHHVAGAIGFQVSEITAVASQ